MVVSLLPVAGSGRKTGKNKPETRNPKRATRNPQHDEKL